MPNPDCPIRCDEETIQQTGLDEGENIQRRTQLVNSVSIRNSPANVKTNASHPRLSDIEEELNSASSQYNSSDEDEERRRHPMRKTTTTFRRGIKERHVAALSVRKLSTSVEIQINDTKVEALLDSGAHTTMMSREQAHQGRISIEPYTGSKQWKSASGGSLNIVGQTKIKLKIGEREIVAKTIIADPLICDMIIGTDIMINNGFKIDFAQKILRVGGQRLPLKVMGIDTSGYACVAMKVYLPARTERKVWLNTGIKGPFIVETNRQCRATVVEGIHQAAEDGTFEVTLRNYSKDSLHIHPGSVVCNITQVNVEGFLVSKEQRDVNAQSEVIAAVNEDGWKPSETAKIDAGNMDQMMMEKYKRLLDQNADVFSRDDTDIGQANIQHDIKLVDYKPFKARAYRIPNIQTAIVEKHVKEMLAMGVIRKSVSPYASPIVLVKKSDNSIRFCVDYRKLNSVTVNDNYPVPLIEERIDRIFGSTIFSGLDLTSGYWQFALTATAQELTAFICHLGLFEFLRMPFGLCNAGATFQRAMESILEDLSFAMAYIDDVLVHSKTHEDHLKHLQIVFDRLRTAKLKVKLRKCDFGCRETKFLGYIISAQGIKMNEEKVSRIIEYPTPKNARQARKFNGLSSYFSDFIPHYTTLNAPIQEAALLTFKDPDTKKRVLKKFVWSEKCQEAFDEIKSIISTKPVLIHPDTTKRFRLITDASGVGLGAVLAQLDDKGKERVICFAGRALIDAERRYTTGERELLAVRWAVRKFKCYLYGVSFDVFTDHRPLAHSKTSRNPSERMHKWIMELEEFNPTYYYRPGKYNVLADVLSRAYEEEQIGWYERQKSVQALLNEQDAAKTNTAQMSFQSDSDSEETVMSLACVDKDELSKKMLTEAQYRDEAIAGILDKLSMWHENNTGQAFKCDKEGTLYMIDTISGNHRVVLPSTYRKHVLQACHNDMGGSHLGREKTLNKVAQRFFWIGMAKDIKNYVATCTFCNNRKTSRRATAPPLIALPSVFNPFDRIAVDFVGPLPTTKRGNNYILVFVDYATRWPEAFATQNRQATTVAEILVREILCRHGAPVQLLSDQGKEFLSTVIAEVCTFTRTHKIQTAAYHPQTNGLCERFNGTLTEMLTAYVNDNQDNWDVMLPIALFGYRTASQESTKYPPAELLYARQIRLPLNIDLFAPKLQYSKQIKDMFRRAQENVARIAEANRKRIENKNTPIVYTKGETIRVREETTKQGQSRKLQEMRWSEPVVIQEIRENNVLVINKGKIKWVNISRCKKAEEKCPF